MTQTKPAVRPLEAVAPDVPFPPLSVEALEAFRHTEAYRRIKAYFADYPAQSFTFRDSRAMLFSLVRLLRPKIVVEIGTLFAGTAELLARALWENGDRGLLYTTDPYGGERCPGIIASWPMPISAITHYYPKNSMEFFVWLAAHDVVPDFVLVDGSHDYECALFDLMMASRHCARGGVVLMDNAEQSGPWRATREFLEANPGWREIGGAIARATPSQPFDAHRASLPDTHFLILKAPDHFDIAAGPHSWGEKRIWKSMVKGLHLDLPAQVTRGTLHYHATLRALANGNTEFDELRIDGKVRLDLDGKALALDQPFAQPVRSEMHKKHADTVFTFEVDLSWQPDPGAPPLAVASVPVAFD